MIDECSHGYQGQCCCNCEHHRPVVGHPENDIFPSKSVMKRFGYVCLIPEPDFYPNVVFMESEHGMCEYWTERDYAKYSKYQTFEALGD